MQNQRPSMFSLAHWICQMIGRQAKNWKCRVLFIWLQSQTLVGFWTCCWPILNCGKLPHVQLTRGIICHSYCHLLNFDSFVYFSFLCGSGVILGLSQAYLLGFLFVCFMSQGSHPCSPSRHSWTFLPLLPGAEMPTMAGCQHCFCFPRNWSMCPTTGKFQCNF